MWQFKGDNLNVTQFKGDNVKVTLVTIERLY